MQTGNSLKTAQKTVVNKPDTLTLHQRAVNALAEVAVFKPELSAAVNAVPTMPRNMVPVLFRIVIEDTRKSDGVNEYPQETAILEHTLMLLEQAPDESRTPEQEEFFAALSFRLDAERMIRVRYAPQNVTVN